MGAPMTTLPTIRAIKQSVKESRHLTSGMAPAAVCYIALLVDHPLADVAQQMDLSRSSVMAMQSRARDLMRDETGQGIARELMNRRATVAHCEPERG